MRKLILNLSVMLCLVHGQSLAQQAGDVNWTLLTNPSPYDDTILSIKVQSDGKIVAAGNSYQGSYKVIAVGRFAGQIPDGSFGNNGMVTTYLDSAHTVANAVELQQDGKIVVAGGYRRGASGDFILVRYKTDGSRDSSFGNNGVVRTDIGPNSFDAATALAIQTDGKIVAAGRSDQSLALCRYHPDGSLDSSFDADGKFAVAVVGATCMKLQTDGKIVVGGGSVVTRLNPDGSLDYSFGTNASVSLTGSFYDMAIQNDGKILVSGDSSNKFAIARLDTVGVPDPSFGKGGLVTADKFIPNGSKNTQVAAWVTVQTDGRIIAGGWALACLVNDCKPFILARYQKNGVPDSSFGKYGKVETSYPYFRNAGSFSAVINNNGELVVAGTDEYKWAMASYYLGPPLGVPTAPVANGQIAVAPNPAEDFARIQATHIENGTWRLSMCDFTGRAVYSEKVVTTNHAFDKIISLTGLPAAMYLVLLDNGSSRMTVKLVKRR